MASEQGARGVEAVTRFLDERDAAYEIVEHEDTFSAAAEASAAGVEPRDAAKTVVLHDRDGYLVAVIPGSMRVDLQKARRVLRATPHLRLASEDEMERAFPAFDVGALPPLGPMLPAPEVVDRRVLDHDRVVCSAGDHSHSLRIDPREILRIAEPRVADICRTREKP